VAQFILHRHLKLKNKPLETYPLTIDKTVVYMCTIYIYIYILMTVLILTALNVKNTGVFHRVVLRTEPYGVLNTHASAFQ